MGFPAATTDGQTVDIVDKIRINGRPVMVDSEGNKWIPSTEPLKLELLEAAVAAEELVEAIADGAEAVVSELAEAAEEIGAAASQAVEAVAEAASDAVEEIGDVIEAGGDFLDELLPGGEDEEPTLVGDAK